MTIREQALHQQLLTLAEIKNQEFVSKLVPTFPKDKILGIKIPILRQFAKDYAKKEECFKFLETLPHYYLEENILHGFLIEQLKDIDKTIEYTEKFLPYIDNWMTCDTFSPKIFKKHPEILYKKIKIWLKSSHSYTIRYAIGLLLSNFLDSEFKVEMVQQVAEIKNEEYYVQMMQARYLATALAKQEACTLPLIKQKTLSPFVQNKTIQKARESRRISQALKAELISFKI